MVSKKFSKRIETSSASWRPTKIEGVAFIPLNTDPAERAGTFLYRIAPGGRYPRHRHPAGEEMYLLKGDAIAGGHALKAGDFLYSPPASVHDVTTREGCVFMSIATQAVRIVPDGTIEEMDVLPDVAEPPTPVDPSDIVTYEPSLRTIDLDPKE
jgi:quercetin dioxygenase-like cupin family protein